MRWYSYIITFHLKCLRQGTLNFCLLSTWTTGTTGNVVLGEQLSQTGRLSELGILNVRKSPAYKMLLSSWSCLYQVVVLMLVMLLFLEVWCGDPCFSVLPWACEVCGCFPPAVCVVPSLRITPLALVQGSCGFYPSKPVLITSMLPETSLVRNLQRLCVHCIGYLN